jgi:ribosomal protein S18 acetylase RimI-like enzyme
VERLVEELTLNAWPSLRTVLDDGWLLRFADGYTRRANSVNPLYRSREPAGPKIARCEGAYARRGLDTVFKLTGATEPAELDGLLAERGYRQEAESIVQIADLGRSPQERDGSVVVAEVLPEGWLEELCRCSGGSGRHLGTMRALLGSIEPAVGFATMRAEGEVVAVAMGVAERGYVGLFDVATAPAARGRGFGRRVVGEVLHWGRERGAERAHLAVQADNVAALRLYAGLGFREAYRYWYRVKARASDHAATHAGRLG